MLFSARHLQAYGNATDQKVFQLADQLEKRCFDNSRSDRSQYFFNVNRIVENIGAQYSPHTRIVQQQPVAGRDYSSLLQHHKAIASIQTYEEFHRYVHQLPMQGAIDIIWAQKQLIQRHELEGLQLKEKIGNLKRMVESLQEKRPSLVTTGTAERPIVLTDDDRKAMDVYWSELDRMKQLYADQVTSFRKIVGKSKEGPSREGWLKNIEQIFQLFREAETRSNVRARNVLVRVESLIQTRILPIVKKVTESPKRSLTPTENVAKRNKPSPLIENHGTPIEMDPFINGSPITQAKFRSSTVIQQLRAEALTRNSPIGQQNPMGGGAFNQQHRMEAQSPVGQNRSSPIVQQHRIEAKKPIAMNRNSPLIQPQPIQAISSPIIQQPVAIKPVQQQPVKANSSPIIQQHRIKAKKPVAKNQRVEANNSPIGESNPNRNSSIAPKYSVTAVQTGPNNSSVRMDPVANASPDPRRRMMIVRQSVLKKLNKKPPSTEPSKHEEDYLMFDGMKPVALLDV